MEFIAYGVVLVAAWWHGYRRGKRKSSTVEMSAHDLRRELRRKKQ